MNPQLGQLIITGIEGKSLNKDESHFIQKNKIGGIILFERNYESPAQLAELVNNIQKLRDEYPLFICVDQEGGRVQRFGHPFYQLPPAKELAVLNSPKRVFSAFDYLAKQLSACGVNVNLAPVCDVLTNDKNSVIGDRAFSNNVAGSSKMVSSVIRGLKTNNVLSCAKHFPGHGDTSKDSHFDLPIVKTSLEQLREREFSPFVKAIKSKVDFIMMAHLIVDAIDDKLPCSLSKKAYDLLRSELKYSRLIITDDMQMKAISDRWSCEEAAFMAIEAGADMIEYRDLEFASKALSALKDAKKTKLLQNKLIEDRYGRIMRAKQENFKEYSPIYIPDIESSFSDKEAGDFFNSLREEIDHKAL